ncbi:transposon Tf2-6 polyprotein [Trichonephila clavipes]|nr:transposon Tf2-6 polyprotein [Trichonephila clavipes]
MYKNALKEDFIRVVENLDGTVESTDTIVKLKTKIENSSTFESDPDFVKTLIKNCIDERVSRNEREDLEKQKIELVKLQLTKLEKEVELQTAKNKALSLNPAAKVEDKQFETNIENMINSIRTLSLPVPTRSENFNLFFQSLERAFLTKKINDEYKSEILINLLGERAHNVLLYIKEEELNDYEKLKSIVLREFQLTPRECLNSFKNAVKSSGETYIQFAARLTANFQYYCSLRKVNSFESLCDLIISDKLFETLNKETATHIGIREAEDWFRPIDLAKECDIYISSRSGSHKEIPITFGYTQDPFKNRSQNFKPKIKENYPQNLERENKNCFICGDSSHCARDCEKRFKPKESNDHIHNRINMNTLKVESEKQNSDEFEQFQYVNIFVENQPVTALIDSGCQIPVLNSSLIRVQTPSEEIITLSSCFGEQRMVEVKPINISLDQHSPSLSVRTAISPTLTEEIIVHPSVYSEIEKLGHAKSDVLLNESESSLGAHLCLSNVVSFSNVIKTLVMICHIVNIVGLGCSEKFLSLGSGNEGKREIVLNRRPELERKISMRSTKDQLVKKDVLMPVKQCFPVEPSGCRRDSPLVSMDVPLRTAYSQDSRYGMQPKARQSSRAGAANQNQNENFKDFGETLTIRKKQKRERERKVNSFESLCDLIISDKLFETLNKETATHIGIREAEDWFRPIDLAKECDIYISSRSGSHKEIPITFGYTQDPFKNRSQNFKPKIKENYPQNLERENKNCFICGDSSHCARDCEKRFKPKESNDHIHNRINVNTLKVESEKQNSDEFEQFQYVNIFVENQPVTALIDSGCQIPVLNSSLIRVQTPSEEIITLSSCFGEQRMVEVKPINISLDQHSPSLSVRTAISPTLTEEIIVHPSVYSEIEKLGHAKSDVLLNESESSLGAHFMLIKCCFFSNVIENSSYDLPHVKNFNTRNDLSSLIKDYKCNKIKSTKLKRCIKLKNDIPVCQRTRRLSCSDNLSPMKSKYRRFGLLRKIFEPWQWKRRKKRNRFEQTSRTREENIDAFNQRSTC